MGVFKEEARTFEKIVRMQSRIYRDACDVGYPYHTDNPPSEVTEVFAAINSLKQLDKEFPEEKDIVRNRTKWMGGVSVDVIIFWEIDEGYYCGTKYHILFNKTNIHSAKINANTNAYISVDVTRYREKA